MRALIIGSGIAGLSSAIRLARAGHHVLVITKKAAEDSSTNWAQGGIAAILDPLDGPGLTQHIEDTMTAGCGLNDRSVVEGVVREASAAIGDLIQLGVEFDRTHDGAYDLAREGGHSNHRILHAKDMTGRAIERALLDAATQEETLEIRTDLMAVDLIQRVHGAPNDGVRGVWALDRNSGSVEAIDADVVVLASGGAGQLYRQTTNPSVATGDGIAMAIRAGAAVRDMEFVQFHPTALAVPGDRPFLITEALRGFGAVLLDDHGLLEWREAPPGSDPNVLSFMLHEDPLGSLATRDVVARAIDRILKQDGTHHVHLITDHLDAEQLEARFPAVSARCAMSGLRLGKDPLPVAPAAHYVVGGLDVDASGRVRSRIDHEPMRGLYAIGEVACTGMHGANRLASNSLLEAVVFAARASEAILSDGAPPSPSQSPPEWGSKGLDQVLEHGPLRADREALQSVMTDDVGLIKRDSRLERASRRLALLHEDIDRTWRTSVPTPDLVELRNMVQVSMLIQAASWEREMNIGLHLNLDREHSPTSIE